MRFRKLRIVFSITCLIACVLLIVLWVRSYRGADLFVRQFTSTSGVSVLSAKGRVELWAGQMREVMITEGFIMPHDRVSDINSFAAGWGFVTAVQNSKTSPSGLTCFRIKTPHWFLFFLLISLASLPWLRWRFSLRTLLIATTLVAVVLGLVVYFARG